MFDFDKFCFRVCASKEPQAQLASANYMFFVTSIKVNLCSLTSRCTIYSNFYYINYISCSKSNFKPTTAHYKKSICKTQGRRMLFDFGQAKPAAVGVATGVDQ